MQKTQSSQFKEEELHSLQKLQTQLVSQVETLDPEKFAKKREPLLRKIDELREEAKELRGSFSGSRPSPEGLIWMRYLALLWNVVFSFVLGRRFGVGASA